MIQSFMLFGEGGEQAGVANSIPSDRLAEMSATVRRHALALPACNVSDYDEIEVPDTVEPEPVLTSEQVMQRLAYMQSALLEAQADALDAKTRAAAAEERAASAEAMAAAASAQASAAQASSDEINQTIAGPVGE